MRRMRKIQMPAITASGSTQPNRRSRQNVFSMRPAKSTLCASRSFTRLECFTPERGGARLGAEERAHPVTGPRGGGGEGARLERALDLLVGDRDLVHLVLA